MIKKQNVPDIIDSERLAKEMRIKIMQLSSQTGAAHLGSSLSCTDLLVALYWHALDIDETNPHDPDRDRFILSKGHAAAALYTTLAYRGFFPIDQLDGYSRDGSTMFEHPTLNCMPGVEASTGSLGHGLSMGLGIALAAKISKKKYITYVIISDGECNEGSTWEASLFAPAKKLGNLVVILDYNKWQATARSNEVLNLPPLAEKWRSFGWNVHEIDGHDMKELVGTLTSVKNEIKKNMMSGKDHVPTMIVANTVKGKGASFMEDDNNWHYRSPTKEEIIAAKKEMSLE